MKRKEGKGGERRGKGRGDERGGKSRKIAFVF